MSKLKYGIPRREMREYRAWKDMKARCYAPSQQDRGNYKVNNIQVCEEWKNSFETFYLDMGKCPIGYTLERIDNDKGYSKDNCKWASWNEQQKNRGSFNDLITYNGETFVLKDWARKLNIKYTTLYNRIYRSGLSFEEAIKDDPYNKQQSINGIHKTVKEWCKEYNIEQTLVYDRIRKGWSLIDALTRPKTR